MFDQNLEIRNFLKKIGVKEEYIESRRQNLKKFFEIGFPSRKQEDWKFLDLSKIISEKILLEASENHNLPLVATNDCFFQNPKKFYSHQVLTCIEKGLTISSSNRRLITPEHYLKDPKTMINLFQDIHFANHIQLHMLCFPLHVHI